MNHYIYILGFMDTINDLNDRLNSFLQKYTDNVGFGTAILLGLLAFSFWAIGYFNKK